MGHPGRQMWKAHDNRVGIITKIAARILSRAGFIPAKIYGNLAGIANRLKLRPIGDNTRFLQMGLLAQEIERKNIPGAIAELGVYQGNFTQFISRAFNDRRFYLFDTFEGFDRGQISKDTNTYNAQGHDFSDTSVNQVLQKIDENCTCEVIVRKGFFPATAEGLEEETFAFVSIDVDLYDPTLDGLRYFYPRLAMGGYIMVHDLMADRYKGCRAAVYEFCEAEEVVLRSAARCHLQRSFCQDLRQFRLLSQKKPRREAGASPTGRYMR